MTFEMSAAWRKRAEEAEAAVEAVRAPRQQPIRQVVKAAFVEGFEAGAMRYPVTSDAESAWQDSQAIRDSLQRSASLEPPRAPLDLSRRIVEAIHNYLDGGSDEAVKQVIDAMVGASDATATARVAQSNTTFALQRRYDALTWRDYFWGIFGYRFCDVCHQWQARRGELCRMCRRLDGLLRAHAETQ